MLGMSFDQLHRCDMSPLATGLGKNKLLQSNAAELPSPGTLGRTALPLPRWGCSHRSGMPKTQLCLSAASCSPCKTRGQPFLAGVTHRATMPAPQPSPLLGSATHPAQPPRAPEGTHHSQLRTHQPLWGRGQPPAWLGGGSSDGDTACGHGTSSALTLPFPTLCTSCCLGRGVNFCSNFTRDFVGRSAMGSWCAASKHPWRHAQRLGGILQPRHLARVCCSKAATRELLPVSDGCLLLGGLLVSPWSASLCLLAVKSSWALWGCKRCSHSLSLCDVPSLSFPGQRQHGELRSISLPDCEGVQCRPLSLVAPKALGTCPGLDLQPHPRMSQLSAGSDALGTAGGTCPFLSFCFGAVSTLAREVLSQKRHRTPPQAQL